MVYTCYRHSHRRGERPLKSFKLQLIIFLWYKFSKIYHLTNYEPENIIIWYKYIENNSIKFIYVLGIKHCVGALLCCTLPHSTIKKKKIVIISREYNDSFGSIYFIIYNHINTQIIQIHIWKNLWWYQKTTYLCFCYYKTNLYSS